LLTNIRFILFEKMKELENKHHYNGQGGGKPPGIGQRG
jgi:hypothetical protein